MKLVYIAGPYRAPTAWGIAENVRAAERVGLEVARAGAMPVIPHAISAHFHGECTDELWIEGTLEMLRRCDAAVFLPNWIHSAGSCGEWDECTRRHTPRLNLERDRFGWPEQCQAICAFVLQLIESDSLFGKSPPV